MITAAIFDMDGLIVDSEPLWQDAEMEVFGKVGVPLTREMCFQTKGLRVDAVVKYWYDQYRWEGDDPDAVQENVVQTLINMVKERGTSMPGVHHALDFFKQKQIPIALATSSEFRIVHTVLDKLELGDYFDQLHSAENEPLGKPHPAIFLNAAKSLGVSPLDCIVFEDSFPGIIAGLAARMNVVTVPDPADWDDSRFDVAHLKLKSLLEFSEEHFEKF